MFYIIASSNCGCHPFEKLNHPYMNSVSSSYSLLRISVGLQHKMGITFFFTLILGTQMLSNSVESVHLHLDYLSKCTFHLAHFYDLELSESILQSNQYEQPW